MTSDRTMSRGILREVVARRSMALLNDPAFGIGMGTNYQARLVGVYAARGCLRIHI